MIQRFILFSILLSLLAISCKEEPCETITCLNGGTCQEEDGSCVCQEGYEGDFCENLVIQKFLGTYQIQYSGCFTTTANHTVSIEQIDGEASKVYINDLGDYDCPGGTVQLEASIAGAQIGIPSQVIDCGVISYTFEGEGTISGGTLNISFTVEYESDGITKTDNCTATLEK